LIRSFSGRYDEADRLHDDVFKLELSTRAPPQATAKVACYDPQL